jgi:hypothetical protein
MAIKSLAVLPRNQNQAPPAPVLTNVTKSQFGLVTSLIVQAVGAEATARDSEATEDLAAQLITVQGLIATAIANAIAALPSKPIFRSYLSGYITAWVSTTSFSVTAGMAADQANTGFMTSASALTKTTAAWTAGTGVGGLDTGAIAANTWYHIFVISKADLSVVDVLFSASPTAPTLPATYTLFRRIGSILTDGSSHFIQYWQWGDMFIWDQLVNDLVDSVEFNSTSATLALTVPTGLTDAMGAIIAILNLQFFNNDVNNYAHVLFQAMDDATSPPVSATNAVAFANTQVSAFAGDLKVAVNSSAQVRIATDNDILVTLFTRGWIDVRGRNV